MLPRMDPDENSDSLPSNKREQIAQRQQNVADSHQEGNDSAIDLTDQRLETGKRDQNRRRSDSFLKSPSLGNESFKNERSGIRMRRDEVTLSRNGSMSSLGDSSPLPSRNKIILKYDSQTDDEYNLSLNTSPFSTRSFSNSISHSIPRSNKIPKNILLSPNLGGSSNNLSSSSLSRHSYHEGSTAHYNHTTGNEGQGSSEVASKQSVKRIQKKPRKLIKRLNPNITVSTQNLTMTQERSFISPVAFPRQSRINSPSNQQNTSDKSAQKSYGSTTNRTPTRPDTPVIKSHTVSNPSFSPLPKPITPRKSSNRISNFFLSKSEVDSIAVLSDSHTENPFGDESEDSLIALPMHYPSKYDRSCAKFALSQVGSVVNSSKDGTYDSYLLLSQTEQKQKLKRGVYFCLFLCMIILSLISLIGFAIISLPMLVLRNPHFMVDSIHVAKIPTEANSIIKYYIGITQYNPNLKPVSIYPESVDLHLSLLDLKTNRIHRLNHPINRDSGFNMTISDEEGGGISSIFVEGDIHLDDEQKEDILPYFSEAINSVGWVLEGEINYVHILISRSKKLSHLQRLYEKVYNK